MARIEEAGGCLACGRKEGTMCDAPHFCSQLCRQVWADYLQAVRDLKESSAEAGGLSS